MIGDSLCGSLYNITHVFFSVNFIGQAVLQLYLCGLHRNCLVVLKVPQVSFLFNNKRKLSWDVNQ